MYTLHHAQAYVEKYGLNIAKATPEQRRQIWSEVASETATEGTRRLHGDAFGDMVGAQIAAVTEAARDGNIKALEELSSIVLTKEIILDVLKAHIAGLVMGTKNLGPFEQPFYTEKRLNKTGLIQNVPQFGAVPTFHVAHMNRMVPIGMADNQASYHYRTRNQWVGAVEERDQAAKHIRRGILDNRETAFINNIRFATLTTAPGVATLVNALPDMALPSGLAAPNTNVLVDAGGVLTKKNLSDLMFMLEFYDYQPKVLYCSAARRNDLRNFVTLTSTSGSPLDFLTQREVLQSGKLEGLFGLQIRVLNYLDNNECYMWDATEDFGDIYLRGGVQVEDRQGAAAFMRELVAAQIEGQAIYNARRIAKLQFT